MTITRKINPPSRKHIDSTLKTKQIDAFVLFSSHGIRIPATFVQESTRQWMDVDVSSGKSVSDIFIMIFFLLWRYEIML